MKFITAQPDSDYFVWQLQVQMNNFKKFDIEKDAIILLSYEQGKSKNPKAIEFSKQTKATVIFINDGRLEHQKKYIPTIRCYLLKTFFGQFGNTSLVINQDFMYHDCDIVFSDLPDFKALQKKKKIQVSDTMSYIGAEYIKSKGIGLLEEMCGIVGVDSKLVEKNEKKSGGAQYFIPKSIRMTYEFWDKVENDSIKLYELMTSTTNKYTPTHPIQSWTADMWALLWNFWKAGYDTSISKELDFSWPTNPIDDWMKYKIYHNAGVTPDMKDFFYKGNYQGIIPFNESHENLNKGVCSYNYVKEIIETADLLKSK